MKLNFGVRCLLLLCCTNCLAADPVKRIESLLAIGDVMQAKQELLPLLENDPDNIALQRLEVISFARSNDILALLKAYTRYRDHAQGASDTALLEDVAWAIIHKASTSSNPIIRSEAFISAFMANDARGMDICKMAMHDTSSEMRLLALTLASRARDETLSESALDAILNDSSLQIRLQAISTVGTMRYQPAAIALRTILEAQSSDTHEKRAAASALANINNHIDNELNEKLAKSDRAYERVLACELMLNAGKKNPILITLMNDASFDVRLAAVECATTLGLYPPKDILEALLAHKDVKTQILANWLALRMGYHVERSISNLKSFLLLPDRQMRLFAAGAISHTGSHIEHFTDMYMQQEDPLVRMNLALGAIWNRHDVMRAANQLLASMNNKDRLSWQGVGLLSFIGPTTLSHDSGYIRLPESEDLALRLELYSMLATIENISITEPLKAFLQERTWGISAKSACLMMQEDLICLDEIRKLLQEDNKEIALQAAFILAHNAQDEEALKVLETSFNKAIRPMKEYILFAIGSIGSKKSLPFLVEVLNEPFESLRVQAARSILLCLYK